MTSMEAGFARGVDQLVLASGSQPEVTADGTTLIGRLDRADGRFPDGYLHEVYAPLDDTDLHEVARLLGREVPPPLDVFYRRANGFSVFCDSLSLSGYVRSLDRAGGRRQPVSLAYGNVLERPEGFDTPHGKDLIKIGFYSYGDAFHVYLHAGSGRVTLCPRHRIAPVLFEWPSLDEFIVCEFDRTTQALASVGSIDPLNVLPPPH